MTWRAISPRPYVGGCSVDGVGGARVLLPTVVESLPGGGGGGLAAERLPGDGGFGLGFAAAKRATIDLSSDVDDGGGC